MIKASVYLTFSSIGGGFGYARNITFRDFEMHNVEQAWGITQCTSVSAEGITIQNIWDNPLTYALCYGQYNGVEGGCDTSRFKISDMHWGNARGTTRSDRVATLDCSAEAPCERVELFDNDLTVAEDGRDVQVYLCDNVVDQEGFECTEPCNGRCPS